VRTAVVAGILCTLAGACVGPAENPTIEFSVVPEAARGGSIRIAPIAGRVRGARAGQQIVLFARSGTVWWVQPFVVRPYTSVESDSTWKNSIHLGTEYAAALVEPGFQPDARSEALPAVGGRVRAVARVKGTGDFVPGARKTLAFSGYEWDVRMVPSDRGGLNEYDGANAWTDSAGLLHLRLAQRDGQWTSAEVSLTRSLGYGTYGFVVRDVSQLDPSAVLSLSTYDGSGADENHRELDIEISQWGDRSILNAQYVVQPYFVAANVSRFAAPPGQLTHSFRWEPGRATFSTVRGALPHGGGHPVSQHEFTSGVPVAGSETVRMNLYYFRYAPQPPQKDVEVVIERFQYFP
jgi:hypothetical protein